MVEPVLNKSLLESYRESDEEGGLVSFLCMNFERAVPSRIAEIEEAARSEKKSDLKFHLHTLKNSFAAIGAENSATKCQEVEDCVDELGCLFVLGQLPVLHEHYQKVLQELRDMLEDFEG